MGKHLSIWYKISWVQRCKALKHDSCCSQRIFFSISFSVRFEKIPLIYAYQLNVFYMVFLTTKQFLQIPFRLFSLLIWCNDCHIFIRKMLLYLFVFSCYLISPYINYKFDALFDGFWTYWFPFRFQQEGCLLRTSNYMACRAITD